MTVNLQPVPTADARRVLPSPTSRRWHDPAVVAEIAGLPVEMVTEFEPTSVDLVATYGTDDPDELRDLGALDVDIAAAERHACPAARGAA